MEILVDYNRGYLEGIIEGEGSLTATKNTKSDKGACIRLSIANDSLELLSKFQSIVPGGRIVTKRYKTWTGYELRFHSKVLKNLLPHLSFVSMDKELRRLAILEYVLIDRRGKPPGYKSIVYKNVESIILSTSSNSRLNHSLRENASCINNEIMKYKYLPIHFGNKTLGDYERGFIDGLIDGEGSIYLKKQKKNDRRNYCANIGIKIEMSNINVLLKAQSIIGGSLFRTKHDSSVKDTYNLQLSTGSLRWLLPQLSFTVPKKEKRRLAAIEYLKYARNGNNQWANSNTKENFYNLATAFDKIDWIKENVVT